MSKDVIIIGGGVGGLFTGALLAKEGMRVTVLEKNEIIGGGLQCFKRNGKIFETGMHVVGGFGADGNLRKICHYLGIMDSLNLQYVPSFCMDEIRYGKTGEIYRIPSGREAFVKAIGEYFPDEEKGIRGYVDAIYRITEEMPLFYLRENREEPIVHSEEFQMSADRLIARYVSDERLRELLAYLNPLYGGVKGHTPAYIHALINVLYLNGATRFAGGSQQLADALADVIVAAGGETISGCEVVGIHVEEKRVEYVEAKDGRRFKGDYYISDVHPTEILRMVGPGVFLKGFVKRLNELPVSYSAFSVYLDLKPGVQPYIDHTCYYMDDFGSMWNQDHVTSDEWPKSIMYMTPPESRQGEYAERMLVHCIMSFEEVRQWEQTSVGRRGKGYEMWKRTRIKSVLNKLENVLPGLSEKIARVYAASPLTIRDYYHTKEGSLFGYSKDCENPLVSQLPVYTKVKNLYLTGQNVNLHGMCGVPLTAIITAEAIVGVNRIVKKINDAFKRN